MTLFVNLPLADDQAKREGRTVWGTFNVAHIACIIPDSWEGTSYVQLSPKDGKLSYDKLILSCSYDEAMRLLNEALISDFIHSMLKESTDEEAAQQKVSVQP